MKIEWSEQLSTGVEILDAQHRELFSRINRLLDACLQRKGTEEILGTVRFLETYVVEHFGMEEEVMRRHAYAGLRHHEELHREFRQRVTDLSTEIERDGVGAYMVVKVNRLLVDWLNAHIRKVDRAMAIKLREQFTTQAAG